MQFFSSTTDKPLALLLNTSGQNLSVPGALSVPRRPLTESAPFSQANYIRVRRRFVATKANSVFVPWDDKHKEIYLKMASKGKVLIFTFSSSRDPLRFPVYLDRTAVTGISRRQAGDMLREIQRAKEAAAAPAPAVVTEEGEETDMSSLAPLAVADADLDEPVAEVIVDEEPVVEVEVAEEAAAPTPAEDEVEAETTESVEEEPEPSPATNPALTEEELNDLLDGSKSISVYRAIGAKFDPPIKGVKKSALINAILERVEG